VEHLISHEPAPIFSASITEKKFYNIDFGRSLTIFLLGAYPGGWPYGVSFFKSARFFTEKSLITLICL
jgi:hypothetical protein